MTLGSPSIRNESTLWTKSQAEGYLAAAIIGVLAGIVVAYARMPLHLPGHKALWWIPPVLATRLLTRRRLGATVGATATIASTLSLGGRLAGGIAAMPLVILAGVLLDVAAKAAERRPVAIWRTVLLLSAAGAAGNVICFVKRLFEPSGSFFSIDNLRDLGWSVSTYAIFGFAAGALGAALAYVIVGFRQRHQSRS
jgi:hypothetical protein